MSQDKPVAIITGGGTGIGAACSRILSRDGFRVGINYIDPVEEQSRQVLSELEDGFLLKADLSNPDEIETMIAEIREKARRVDVLVNGAGISINKDINSMTLDDFDLQRAIVREAGI